MIKYLIFLFCAVFFSAVSQLLLKISANKKYSNKLREYFNFYVIVAYTLFFACVGVTILAYKIIDLKYGPIIEASGYVFIFILGKIFLKERITKNKIVGNLLLIIGIIVFNL